MNAAESLRQRLDELEPDSPADEVLAEQVLATLTLVERLEADIETNGVTITGARGQVVANPSVAGIARQRLVLAQLLGRLFPPEETRGQYRARRAANARARSGR